MKQRHFYLTALLCCALCGATAPETQPAKSPVQTLAALDQPLALDGATGQVADWLKAFDVPAGKFTYTQQLVDAEDGYRQYRVVYASSFKSPSERNNVVPAEFYLPGTVEPQAGAAKIPAAVVLDILAGNASIARSVAIGLATRGVGAIYFPMAYYGSRRAPGSFADRWFDNDPHRGIDALRQTVMDIRRAKAILAAEPEIDPHQLGITGVSLGGIVTALAAGVDGTFDRVVPILSGGDIAALTFSTRETRRVRGRLEAKGIDQKQLEAEFAPVEPLTFARRIDPARCLMINAANDEVIPRLLTEKLAIAIGGPTVLWLPAGHYSAILYMPTVQNTTASFLRGNKVDRLQYGYFTSPAQVSR